MVRYSLIFLSTVLVASVLTWLVKICAQHWQIVDDPQRAPERKLHVQPIPLLGGVALYLTGVIMVGWFWSELTAGYLLPKYLFGIASAGLVLLIGGTLDDRYHLSPKHQIIFPILATVSIVASGIGIEYITNPFGGVINLEQWHWTIFSVHNLPYQLVLLADVFTVGWLLVTMYTTKLLDGLDGLVPGISVIGGIIIFFVSLSDSVGQPETALLALILAGAAAGFLLWNFSPAKIYLGESGALFTGFMLGVLAILSGGKIATALLILGLPMIDILWVVLRRVFIERRSPFSGDALHLHYQLRHLGMSERAIVLLFYSITVIFGLSTLFFNGLAKVILLAVLGLCAIGLFIWLFIRSARLDG